MGEEITMKSIVCFNCGRSFELNESNDGKLKKMWGQCPIEACGAIYDIRIIIAK